MKQVFVFVLAAGVLFAAAYYMQTPVHPVGTDIPVPVSPVEHAVPEKIVLDISIHTIEGLGVLFDRAEELAKAPQLPGEDHRVVLVLHGPEVEFFAAKNYDKYRDIVDQAARLDAIDVVDVKICQTMLDVRGIAGEDIPSFIDQVPFGPGEVARLQREGYIVF